MQYLVMFSWVMKSIDAVSSAQLHPILPLLHGEILEVPFLHISKGMDAKVVFVLESGVEVRECQQGALQ